MRVLPAGLPAGLPAHRWRALLFSGYVRAAPWIAIAFLVVPVAGGLLGVIGPAFGWLPTLGGTSLSIDAWHQLAAMPGLNRMVLLSLTTGLGSALVSLVIVLLFLAAFIGTRVYGAMQRLLSPILSIPHAAAAIGFAFLIAPSGLVSRLVSPWLTGWARPPDLLIVGDPSGLAMTAGLVTKEVPFLLLMCLAAIPQCRAGERLTIARTLGYRPVAAWFKSVVPALYPLIRLPVYAVIAYASSTVEVALILGPSTPPPLAVSVVRWMNDPDLTLRFMASAGALLQLGVTVSALAIWWAGERLVAAISRGWLVSGGRRLWDRALGLVGLLGAGLSAGAAVFGLVALAIWSVAGFWRFPDAWPRGLSARTWGQAADTLWAPLANAAIVGVAATAIAVLLVVGSLEAEVQRGRPASRRTQAILYLPLLVPPVAFLFGLVLLQEAAGVSPGFGAVIASHVVFVLPYVYLSLVEAYRRLDPRWDQVARSLGAGPARSFFRVRLPLLTTACLTAIAIGFAVSIGQYLPTQLLGAGRVPTITTEAVSLASGGDRRVASAYGLLQAILPALGFAVALAGPRLLYRRRKGMR